MKFTDDEILFAQEMGKRIVKREAYVKAWADNYGHVREPVNLVVGQNRLVAIGPRIYSVPANYTYADFISGHAWDLFGEDWWTNEDKKAGRDRHPVLTWYQMYLNLMCEQGRPGELVSYKCHGASASWIMLAYNLFVLDDNHHLQQRIVSRLRINEQFPGARHELNVAAVFSKEGFTIHFEDESGSRNITHPEFIATHIPTDSKFAIEAKHKNREGIMAFNGTVPKDESAIKPDTGKFVGGIFKKKSPHPLFLFIDPNLPPNRTKDEWVEKLIKLHNKVLKTCKEENYPKNLAGIVYMNDPAVHRLNRIDYGPPWYKICVSEQSPFTAESPLILDLAKSLKQLRVQPSSFPDIRLFPEKII